MRIKGFFCFRFGKRFQAIWYTIFIFCLFLLMGAQLALTTPAARNALSEVSEIESMSTDVADGFNLGEITLNLKGVKPSKDIKILLNGQVISLFVQSQINITVSNNALIEIDGTAIKEPFSVEIDNIPSNITFAKNKKSTNVESNIAILARIFVK